MVMSVWKTTWANEAEQEGWHAAARLMFIGVLLVSALVFAIFTSVEDNLELHDGGESDVETHPKIEPERRPLQRGAS